MAVGAVACAAGLVRRTAGGLRMWSARLGVFAWGRFRMRSACGSIFGRAVVRFLFRRDLRRGVCFGLCAVLLVGCGVAEILPGVRMVRQQQLFEIRHSLVLIHGARTDDELMPTIPAGAVSSVGAGAAPDVRPVFVLSDRDAAAADGGSSETGADGCACELESVRSAGLAAAVYVAAGGDG